MTDKTYLPAIDLNSVELNIFHSLDMIDRPEELIMLGEFIASLKKIAAHAETLRKDKFIELLNDGPGSFTFGDTRYYVGSKKKTKAVGNWQVMEALLEHTGGDAKQIAGCLASNAWKQGGIKTLIGEDQHKELFTTEVVLELKEGKPGKPIKELKQFPTNLIKKTN